MDEYQLLLDLHKNADRQGPGGDAETWKALDLAQVDTSAPLQIADIGCGTGASTLLLTQLPNARITAVDLFPEFLHELEKRAARTDVTDKISRLPCSMDNLPFDNETFDVLWSEGAIYNIGFTKGIRDWHRFLKPGGILVVSELTWTTGDRPSEIHTYWAEEYPEIETASAKIGILEHYGYAPIGYFVLPEHCWSANYYQPMQNRFKDFLERNGNSDAARAIVEAEKKEIALYESYKTYYSYGVYIARKVEGPN